MMRTEAPNEREGRGLVNLARTTPELPKSRVVSITLLVENQSVPERGLNAPWGRVTLPQTTRILEPRISFCAL